MFVKSKHKILVTLGSAFVFGFITRLELVFSTCIFCIFAESRLLKKTKYWRRNGGFLFLPEEKARLLSDSLLTCMYSMETHVVGRSRVRAGGYDLTNSIMI